MSFTTISPGEYCDNVFDVIGKQWLLICVNDGENTNAMTASWGGLGVLWFKNVGTCYIRPQRYTFELMERAVDYTLCVLPEGYKEAYEMLGRKSGRNSDKMDQCGLTLVREGDVSYFKESRLVIVQKKLYAGDFKPEKFVDQAIHEVYPNKDYHRMYIGEVTEIKVRQS